MKIVTLLPSATEIVARLGLEKNLVGVSHECDFPETVTSLPKLTSSRINKDLSSGKIHQSVMEVMKSAVSVYDLDIELSWRLAISLLDIPTDGVCPTLPWN